MKLLMILLSAVIGYAFGNLPSGVIVAKLMGGPDIRKTGSGNTGTTNVLRTMGWKASALTLLGDVLKGMAAAFVGKLLGGEVGMLVGGLFGVLGHNFPATLGFKGGKGIATSWGVTMIVCPWTAPWLFVIVIGIVALTRLMSLGSIIAAVSYPFLMCFLRPEGTHFEYYLAFSLILSVLAIVRHRANIVRLLKGEENALDFGKINKITKERSRKQ